MWIFIFESNCDLIFFQMRWSTQQFYPWLEITHHSKRQFFWVFYERERERERPLQYKDATFATVLQYQWFYRTTSHPTSHFLFSLQLSHGDFNHTMVSGMHAGGGSVLDQSLSSMWRAAWDHWRCRRWMRRHGLPRWARPGLFTLWVICQLHVTGEKNFCKAWCHRYSSVSLVLWYIGSSPPLTPVVLWPVIVCQRQGAVSHSYLICKLRHIWGVLIFHMKLVNNS